MTSRWAFDPAAPGTWLITHTVYDAFGRTVLTYSPDNEDFTGTVCQGPGE